MKKKVISILFAIILIFTLKNTCNAASATITCNDTATVGEQIEISATVNAVQWNLAINVNGETIKTNSELENYESNKTVTFSATYTPKEEGTLNITLTGTATEFLDGSTIRSFTPRTITVKAAPTVTTPEPEPETSTTPEKSTNANLSNLGIKPTEYDFNNFKSSRTSYTATVPYDVEDVEVWYKLSDSKSTVKVTGGNDLKVGANTITIVVTAEAGNTKTYKITVTRKAEETVTTTETPIKDTTEETEEEIPEENEAETTAEEGDGLKTLVLSDVELEPKFSTNVYEYTARLTKDISELDIQTKATSDDYKVVIAGNENLVDGENLITLIVYDGKDKIVATYQITVVKNVINQEEIDNILARIYRKEMIREIVLKSILVLIIVLIILYIIVSIKSAKLKKKIKARQQENEETQKDNDMPQGNIFIEENIEIDNNNEIEEDIVEEEKVEEVKTVEKKKGKHF